MSPEPRILFVCNAGPAVGGGHVMRSLTLAGALSDLGATCTFLAPPSVANVLDAFAPEASRAPAASTTPADLAPAAVRVEADALVFDHYDLAASDHDAMAGGRPVLVIDDLADRPLGADMVLDSGPARRAMDYAGLVPAHAQVLTGPMTAPVRPEFAALRPEALARRGGPVRRVQVALGLTDVGGVTGRVVEALRPVLGRVALDVVVGGQAPSLESLRRIAAADSRVRLHVDAQDMARLTLEADLAVGAAGSTTWERCVLGLPSVLIQLARNQIQAASFMKETGAALTIDLSSESFMADLTCAIQTLLADDALRADLSARSAALCDGRGAERVAATFMALVRSRA